MNHSSRFQGPTEICELQTAVSAFEGVIKAGGRLRPKDRLAAILRTFLAMLCALKIRTCLGTCDGKEDVSRNEITQFGPVDHDTFPTFDSVHKAAERLIRAAVSRDSFGTVSALNDMGVFALCPTVSQQFARMESLVGCVIGCAQVIPLIELSFAAVSLGDFELAAKYDLEARHFNPTGYEAYQLFTLEGLLAVNAGQQHQAVQLLEQSIAACQHDEYSSLACGVRGLNLALAEKLLDLGNRIDVLEHLLECRNVWQSLRPQIERWISVIESGERPNFNESGMVRAMNGPAFRLLMQYARARALEECESTSPSGVPMSTEEVMARREQLREEYRRDKDRPYGK